MGRGPESPATKAAKAAALAAQFLGKPVETLEINLPVETTDDKMAEAQAILNYFEVRGEGFRDKQCKQCGDWFAYRWNRDAIAYCSVYCGSKALEQIGLHWNPLKDLKERYGRTAPMVVPPAALEILKEQLA